MNIDQLIVFHEIIKHGTMRSAAESLHKSQPALSASLKNLEEEIGFELFDRSTYRPKLSEKGRLFAERSQEILNNMQDLTQYALELKGSSETRLRIALDSAAPFESLLPRIQHLTAAHPTLELDYSFGVLTQCVDHVLNDTADMAIGPILQPHNELAHEHLLTQKLVCVVHKKHCENNDTPIAKKLRSLPNIIVGSGKQNNPLSVPGLKGGKRMHVSNHAIKEQLILCGIGWGRISEDRLNETPFSDRLEVVQHPQLQPVELSIEIIWKRNRTLGPISQNIRNDLIKFCRNTSKMFSINNQENQL